MATTPTDVLNKGAKTGALTMVKNKVHGAIAHVKTWKASEWIGIVAAGIGSVALGMQLKRKPRRR